MVSVNHEDAAHEAMRSMTEESYSHVLLVTGSRTWDDEDAMRQAFNAAWLAWVPATVTRPRCSCQATTLGAPMRWLKDCGRPPGSRC